MKTSEGEDIIPCTGSVTIQDVRLPLKTEYVLNQGSGSKSSGDVSLVFIVCQLLSLCVCGGDTGTVLQAFLFVFVCFN